MGLISVKQRDGESLQDYVKRFHAVTLNRKNLEDQWAIDSFIMGVHSHQGSLSQSPRVQDEEWTTPNTKRKTHLRSVISISPLKRLHQQEKWKVEFNDEDEDSICNEEGNDPMVVSTTIAGFKVTRILVDSGSVVDVLIWDVYQKIRSKEQALRMANPLYSFANHPVEVKGCIIHLLPWRIVSTPPQNMLVLCGGPSNNL
ncbi:hypothetical protein PVK06_028300 [Gossypium arboreum]|uniref:Retrotransposon gag domain-containing protein n=1 Tax=Gossypium arboreum TaxID=29729 RepID=A0ABR0P317_GOSAR|nr:hypothetical protein PVK06_028300 [Gossypium arboreum]